jgi:hypothetical protein
MGLVLLLAINIVFLINIETTIFQAITDRQPDESEWTFGQTLALLLLSLPIRDVFEFIRRTRAEKHRERCTKQLKSALKSTDIAKVKELANYADVRVEVQGMLTSHLRPH